MLSPVPDKNVAVITENANPRRIVIMGAAGRDFHNFNVLYRHDSSWQVVAFTAAQIPGIAGRRYPSALAGPLYPGGIPGLDEVGLATICREYAVDGVVFAYGDVEHAFVMHKASIALAAGADFTLLGPIAAGVLATSGSSAVIEIRSDCGITSTGNRGPRQPADTRPLMPSANGPTRIAAATPH